MKSNILNIVLFSLILLSCKKVENVEPQILLEDNGCIEGIVIPVNAHSIKEGDVATANTLFLKNNIDNSNYRYFRYMDDSLQTQFPPYAKINYKNVRVDQYVNGIKIFYGDLIFIFKNEIFDFMSGNKTKGTNLDIKSKLNLGQLRKLFLDDTEKFKSFGNIYKDSCLKAEFGYYDLNIGGSKNIIKVWRVSPKNRDYPYAFYQDFDGKLLFYDDGIITFK